MVLFFFLACNQGKGDQLARRDAHAENRPWWGIRARRSGDLLGTHDRRRDRRLEGRNDPSYRHSAPRNRCDSSHGRTVSWPRNRRPRVIPSARRLSNCVSSSPPPIPRVFVSPSSPIKQVGKNRKRHSTGCDSLWWVLRGLRSFSSKKLRKEKKRCLFWGFYFFRGVADSAKTARCLGSCLCFAGGAEDRCRVVAGCPYIDREAAHAHGRFLVDQTLCVEAPGKCVCHRR